MQTVKLPEGKKSWGTAKLLKRDPCDPWLERLWNKPVEPVRLQVFDAVQMEKNIFRWWIFEQAMLEHQGHPSWKGKVCLRCEGTMR